MKLLALLFAASLGTLTLADAQPQNDEPRVNADAIVTLKNGTLVAVVNEIESRVASWPQIQGGAAWVMPNILFSKDALEAIVPGDLRLRGVSPLEALAFAAAAAGCTLEPILVPTETPNAPAKRVAGYRIEVDRSVAPFRSRVSTTISGGATFTPGKTNSAGADGLKLPPVALDGGRLNIGTSVSGGLLIKDGLVTAPLRAPEDPVPPSVRVSALGPLITGSKDEVANKKRQLSELIEEALRASGSAGDTPPALSFHVESRTLIVKATISQHEIIEQVIKALKENEGLPGESGKP